MLTAASSPPVAWLSISSFPGEHWEYPRDQGAYKDADDETAFDAEDDNWKDVPSVGKNEELKRALFTLTAEKPVAGKIYTAPESNRQFVVRLAERKAPSGEELAVLTAQARRALLARRQREAYKAWYATLLTKAEADGDIKYTDAWTTLVEQEWDAYRTAASRAVRKP